jgi:hypothetical protein
MGIAAHVNSSSAVKFEPSRPTAVTFESSLSSGHKTAWTVCRLVERLLPER